MLVIFYGLFTHHGIVHKASRNFDFPVFRPESTSAGFVSHLCTEDFPVLFPIKGLKPNSNTRCCDLPKGHLRRTKTDGCMGLKPSLDSLNDEGVYEIVCRNVSETMSIQFN